MPPHTTAMIDGHKWYWYQARLCDEYPGSHLKMVRWCLKDDNDHVGDFPTKRKMMAWIKEDGPEWIAGYKESER